MSRRDPLFGTAMIKTLSLRSIGGRRRSAEPALLGEAGFVLGAQALDGLVFRDLGGGDVPPRPGAGEVDMRDDRHDDDDGALVAAGLVEGGTHLFRGVR